MTELKQYTADRMKMEVLDPPMEEYVALLILADTEEKVTMTLALDVEQFETFKLSVANMGVDSD